MKFKVIESSKKNSNYTVVTNWYRTEKYSPAFKKLMELLLKPKDNSEDNADS